MTTNKDTKKIVKTLAITEPYYDQRVDNFLFNHCKVVPKGRIYKAIRKGEVRVNGKRIQAFYKLQAKDVLRIPPFHQREQPLKPKASPTLSDFIDANVLYEDPHLIILNKPSGLAVHSGSGISMGIIEVLKQRYSPEIELAHRLDRETSGCLLIAKKRSILKEIHQLLAERKITKTYLALLKGNLHKSEYSIDFPLMRKEGATNRAVAVNPAGKPALTIFKPLRRFKQCTLVEVELHTGRMHQIRVHASAIGHPVAGDDKYGDFAFNQEMKKWGLNRLFLHAAMLKFKLSGAEHPISLCACLESDLLTCLRTLS